MRRSVNILGSVYRVTYRNYTADPLFERLSVDGYCDPHTHRIVLCKLATHPRWQGADAAAIRAAEAEVARHEIVHAYLSESGLAACSGAAEAWAEHEELVDWVAMQGPKIYHTWQILGCV